MDIVIYTDGAARGNPGESASGYAVYDSGGRLIHKEAVYNGINTNNYAEYNAIIGALVWCKRNMGGRDVNIRLFSDSQLVVRQLNGEYRVRSERMRVMNTEVLELSKYFDSVSFGNLPRGDKMIASVDRDLNILLDSINVTDEENFK